MRDEFSWTPGREGVFGPELGINAVSGVGCLRFEDGRVAGDPPGAPSTNAFVVWLGRPIVVVSEGVQEKDAPIVTAGLRELLDEANLPVVISLGRTGGQGPARAITVGADGYDRELARAEAYVLVQAAWIETDTLTIELNGRLFVFRVEFRTASDGRLTPHVE